MENFIKSIESEWEAEEGFFWKVRQGNFEIAEGRRALSKVAAVPTLTDQAIPARLVSVLWFVPLFLEWQVDRVRENGGNVAEYKVLIDRFFAGIERILGVP